MCIRDSVDAVSYDDNIAIYDANAAVTVYGNTGADSVYVEQTHAQVDIFTHDGLDNIYIKANEAVINIDSGIEIDYIKIGASATVVGRVLNVSTDGTLDGINASINLDGNTPSLVVGGDILEITDTLNTLGRDITIVCLLYTSPSPRD